MTNVNEITEENRKKLNELAEQVFPLLFSPELLNAAREFEKSFK